MAVCREIGDRDGEGAFLNNISQIYQAWGKYEDAFSYLKTSLKIRQEMGDRNGEATTCHNIAAVFLHLGRIKEAIEMAEIAVDIYQALQSPNLELSLELLARLRAKLQG